MAICRASELQPGDVLLTPGDLALAAGQGPYGHATVAITRLCWLETGLKGVGLKARDLGLFQDISGETFWGFLVADGAVLKRKSPPQSKGDVWAHMTAEAGREYASRAKLLQLPDLTTIGRRSLRSPRSEFVEEDDPLLPGRLCSEATSIVAGLDDTLASPNALATHEDLVDVTGAIESDATFVTGHPRNAELQREAAGYDARAVPEFAAELQKIVEEGRANGRSQAEMLAQLPVATEAFDGRLRNNVQLIVRLDEIEGEMLRAPTAT